MRALTLKQPWADAITYGPKRTENRTWTTKYRGPVLIHAGAAYDLMGRFIITDRAALNSWPDTRKAVIATAELVDIHAAAKECCPQWGEPNVYHWVLDHVTALAAPVPCNGRQGLWTPDADLQKSVADQAVTS